MNRKLASIFLKNASVLKQLNSGFFHLNQKLYVSPFLNSRYLSNVYLQSNVLSLKQKQVFQQRKFSSDEIEKDFQAALSNSHKIPTSDSEKQLKLYALAQQATIGPCSEDNKPSVFNDKTDKAKWQAWKSLGEMSKEDAKKEYVQLVNEATKDSPGKSSEPQLLFEKREQVYWIRLNRPKRYNAITMEMYDGIIEALRRSAEDPDIRFVVFTGNGPYFSSGNDLSNFTRGLELADGDSAKAAEASGATFRKFVAAFIDFPKPLIGVINGPAYGALFTVLALFDTLIASDKAYFRCPFSTLGMTPEGCSTFTFPKIFGPSLASELLYYSYAMSAEEACKHGFVSRVVPSDQIEAHINDWLYGEKGIVKNCYSSTMYHAKSLMRNEEMRLKLHEVNKNECDLLMQSWLGEDFAEALMKFLSRK